MKTKTLHGTAETAFDSPEWQAGFAKRAKELQAAIERIAAGLCEGIITGDAGPVNDAENILFDAIEDLDDLLALSEPERACAIASIAHDLLWCGYALGRRGEPHPEIERAVKEDAAAVARAGRKPKDDGRAAAIRAAIIVAAKTAKATELDEAWWFAESIREHVWAELSRMGVKKGNGNDWTPDSRTISSHISTILIERRKSSD